MSDTSLAARLEHVQHRIEVCSPHPSRVRMVAVTKGFSADVARSVAALGVVDLGENYAQELIAKAPAVGAVTWHFLGPVQRNKVAALAPIVGWWHGIDRVEVAEVIARRSPGTRVLAQVNVSGAERRPGVSWDDAPALVEHMRSLPLDVRGLMAVATHGSAGAARAEFARLARLAESLGLADLSMGMTDDLDDALAAGATIVRVGRALLGPRPQSPRATE